MCPHQHNPALSLSAANRSHSSLTPTRTLPTATDHSPGSTRKSGRAGAEAVTAGGLAQSAQFRGRARRNSRADDVRAGCNKLESAAGASSRFRAPLAFFAGASAVSQGPPPETPEAAVGYRQPRAWPGGVIGFVWRRLHHCLAGSISGTRAAFV